MSLGFTTCLQVKLKEGTDCVWVITAPLKYWSERLYKLIVVPHWFETEATSDQLFETDFASVPRVPVVYDAWGDRAHREAVLHDYLYRIDSIPVVSRYDADMVFLEAMKSTGKPWYIRWPMFMGVRCGGIMSYHKKSVKDKFSNG